MSSTDTSGGSIQVDLRGAEHLDGLTLVPKNGRDILRLSRIVAEQLPGISTRRTAEGIWVPARHTPLLKNLGQGVKLNWNEATTLFVENRARVQASASQVRGEVEALLEGGPDAARERLVGVQDLDSLDDHQLVNVAAMTVKDGFGLCVFDEQGAGKTVTLIHALDVLVSQDEVDFALIIAPKSMVPEWPEDFRKFKADLYSVAVLAGPRAEKSRTLASKADVIIANFETAVAMEADLAATLRWHAGRSILVVDESFFIKNPDAKRARSIRRIRELCGRAFVLCGTPAPNSPHDLIEQFNLVDFGFTFEGLDIPEERAAALPVIRRAVEERGLHVRHLKQDVLPDLKAKAFNRVMLEMEPTQARLYDATLRNLVLDLEAINEDEFRQQVMNFLERRSKLLQICSHPASVAEGYSQIPAKLLALDRILPELIGQQNEKVVLWSFYTASIEAIMNRYPQYNPVRYDGTISDIQDRRAAVRNFQGDDRTMLFVANPAAAGAGITLHRARYAVYESFSNQAAHHLQSLDRIHRRGQIHDVEYLILLCDGTIEIAEYDRLVRKEQAAQHLLGDQVDPPLTREAMLREAVESLRALQVGRTIETEAGGQ